MRYFRYRNIDKNFNNAIKEQYKTLNREEKYIFRKGKLWRNCSKVVSLLVFFSSIVAGIILLKVITLPDIWYLKVLGIAGKVLGGAIFLIASGVIAIALTMPFLKKAESFHIPSMKKEVFSKACAHLREYYQLQEPYLITKCFDATDKKFQNHDVCIFVVGDELRITTDLVHGFLHGKRDLGCYAFKQEEITLLKRENGKYLIAELSTDKMVFTLGYRAKGFIEKFFGAKTVRYI